MKKITQFALVALLTSSVADLNAQGFLKKMVDKANAGSKPKVETKKGPIVEQIATYPKDFSDDLGIGGTYFVADTIFLEYHEYSNQIRILEDKKRTYC